jgi:predicted dehydrogenase
MDAQKPLQVAVVGAGYWGPNLARNFNGSSDWILRAVCDLDVERARKITGPLGNVDAVAIATPARTHSAIALQALRAGKHVLVEKPLADCTANARLMTEEALHGSLVLMTDHTYCYTPAVEKIRELIADGTMGDLLYVDSTRINLGLVQPDVDVFWDLAPHDLSILDYVLPGGLNPYSVSAHGADPLGAGKSCLGYLTMPLPNEVMAHVNVNWLSPTKIRQLVIGGTRRTLVWDDLNPQQRISVYDRGVTLGAVGAGSSEQTAAHISYRLGDTWSPALPEYEPLGRMVSEFAAAIRSGRPARTDGEAGLRVLSVLEAASASLSQSGQLVRLDTERLPDTEERVLEGSL